MSAPQEQFGPSHPLYERMSIFQQADKAHVEFCENQLQLSNEDEKFWWDAISGLLSTAMAKAGYPENLQTKFLSVYRQTLPAIGPRPFANGKPQRYSPVGYDKTPFELSWNWDGSNSTIRFAFDNFCPPDDVFAQANTRALLGAVGQQFPSFDFELFDAVAQNMWIQPENQDRILKKYFPADPTEPSRVHISTAFDLLKDGSVTVKAYVSTLVKTLEVRKTQNEVAGGLVRWLDTEVFSATPILPAYRIIDDYNRSCPEDSKQRVWGFGWDCVKPSQSRLKVYVFKEKTSLKNLRDMWTQGGRLTGREITIGLEMIDELWSELYLAPERIADDAELKNQDGITQSIMLNLEIKPGATFPVPKLYLQPAKFGRSDQDISNNLANWFERRGWPLSKTWVADVQNIL